MSSDVVDDNPQDSRKHLKPIIINRRRYTNADMSLYRVYTSASEFKLVEADSAHEAYTKSGLSRVHKIERENFFRYLSVKKELIEKSDSTVTTTTELPDRDGGPRLVSEFVRTHEGNFNTKGDFKGLNISDLAYEEKSKLTSVIAAPEKDFVLANDITEVVATVSAEPAAQEKIAPAIEVNNEPMSADELDKLFGKEDLSTEDVNALFSKESMSGEDVDKLFAKENMSADDVDALFGTQENLSPNEVDALFGNKESLSATDVNSLVSKKSTMSTAQVDKLFAPDIDPDEDVPAQAQVAASEFELADKDAVEQAQMVTQEEEPEEELSDEDIMSLLAPPPAS